MQNCISITGYMNTFASNTKTCPKGVTFQLTKEHTPHHYLWSPFVVEHKQLCFSVVFGFRPIKLSGIRGEFTHAELYRRNPASGNCSSQHCRAPRYIIHHDAYAQFSLQKKSKNNTNIFPKKNTQWELQENTLHHLTWERRMCGA